MKPILLCAAAVLIATPSLALAKPTAGFLSDAIKGDRSEITLGALAARRGQSAATRNFGRVLRADHLHARSQAIALARRDHVAVPTSMMPEARAEYRKLSGMRGRAFDREFARYMINDHRKDISEFQQQARVGREGTAMLARQTLPTLRKHLRMAMRIS